MNDLRTDVLLAISAKIEMNPLFDVCIDDAIDLVQHSKINEVTFRDYYPYAELVSIAVYNFASHAELLLKSALPDSPIVFRGVRLRDYSTRIDELLSQLYLLGVRD